jgi:ABC-type transport system involved in multi-copper enzyme maturation permease subunit
MSFLWPILAIIFAISLANYISVREIDSGTVEVIASLPVKRERIFIERYLTGALLLLIFSFASMLLAIPLAKMHGIDFLWQNYVTSAVGSFFLAWAVYSLALLFSTLASEKGKATALASATLLLMYVINIVASLKSELSDLKYLSFFNYFNGSELLAKNTFPESSLLALGGFAIIASAVALMWYRRRDLSV